MTGNNVRGADRAQRRGVDAVVEAVQEEGSIVLGRQPGEKVVTETTETTEPAKTKTTKTTAPAE